MTVKARGESFQFSFMINGLRVRRSFPTHDEALEAELKSKRALRAGKPLPFLGKGHSETWTLSEAYGRVWKLYWNDTTTVVWQRRHMDKVLDHFGKNRPVNEITTEMVRDFQMSLKGKGLANSTVNHSLQSLRKVLKHSDECEKLNKMPVFKSLKLNNSRTRYLTKDECVLLIEGARTKDLRDAIIFSLGTGVRLGELLRIKHRHLEDGVLYIPSSKNGDPRSIPLHPKVQVMLEGRKGEKEDLVFPIAEMAREPWSSLRNMLGLEDVVWHTLRHTFASHLVQSGVDLNVVKELMGHRSINTTLRYAKLAPKNYRDAITQLDL